MAISRQVTMITPQLLYGHTWTPPPAVQPCLLSAIKIRENASIRSRLVTHRHWALDYPYTAGLEVRIGASPAAWQTRLPQVAHLYPPGTPYWERRDARKRSRGHEEIYVTFDDGDTLRPLLSPKLGYARFLDSAGHLEKLLAEAARVGTVLGNRGFWKGQAILCGILDLLLTARRVDVTTWHIPGPDDDAEHSDFIRTVERYLREHLSERLTLAEIARHAHVSISTLTHRYHAETGHSPMDTLRHLRLSVAKGLLTRGWTLKEIAAQTGFVDAFHFSKTFKRIIGLSPRDFLRPLRGKTMVYSGTKCSLPDTGGK